MKKFWRAYYLAFASACFAGLAVFWGMNGNKWHAAIDAALSVLLFFLAVVHFLHFLFGLLIRPQPQSLVSQTPSAVMKPD